MCVNTNSRTFVITHYDLNLPSSTGYVFDEADLIPENISYRSSDGGFSVYVKDKMILRIGSVNDRYIVDVDDVYYSCKNITQEDIELFVAKLLDNYTIVELNVVEYNNRSQD
ncbi:MAG: hypothetical protein PHW00_01770 [Clostridia bacterium]|nr:hypothetical protein [Clostridia bacterium]